MSHSSPSPMYSRVDGRFVHPLQRLAVPIKRADGTTEMTVPNYILDMKFDVEKPFDPALNNIIIVSSMAKVADAAADDAAANGAASSKDKKAEKARPMYAIAWRGGKNKRVLLPPLVTTSREWSTDGTLGKPVAPNRKQLITDPSRARYKTVLNGHSYDVSMADPDDKYQRNRDWQAVEQLEQRLLDWVISYIWHSTPEQMPHPLRDMLRTEEENVRALAPTFTGYTLAEVIKRFRDKLNARGFVRTPASEAGGVPASARTYCVVEQNVFQKVDPTKPHNRDRGIIIDDPAEKPEPPGFLRRPLLVQTCRYDPVKKAFRFKNMTRAELDTVQSGDVIVAPVEITLGIMDSDPSSGKTYACNIHLRAPLSNPLYHFGPGANQNKDYTAEQDAFMTEEEQVLAQAEAEDAMRNAATAGGGELAPPRYTGNGVEPTDQELLEAAVRSEAAAVAVAAAKAAPALQHNPPTPPTDEPDVVAGASDMDVEATLEEPVARTDSPTTVRLKTAKHKLTLPESGDDDDDEAAAAAAMQEEQDEDPQPVPIVPKAKKAKVVPEAAAAVAAPSKKRKPPVDETAAVPSKKKVAPIGQRVVRD